MPDTTELITQVREGMSVYDSAGEKIGDVGDVYIGLTSDDLASGVVDTEEQSYFQVKRGFLGLGNDLWVPAAAIQGVSEDGVTLLYSQDSAEASGWGDRPQTGGAPSVDAGSVPVVPSTATASNPGGVVHRSSGGPGPTPY